LGKITADGTKGNLDASLAYNLLRNLMWTSAELAQVLQCGFPARHSATVESLHTHLGGSDYQERLRLYRIP